MFEICGLKKDRMMLLYSLIFSANWVTKNSNQKKRPIDAFNISRGTSLWKKKFVKFSLKERNYRLPVPIGIKIFCDSME